MIGAQISRRTSVPRSDLFRPILHSQSAYSREFLLIVRHQRQPRSQRVRGDPEIVVANHFPLGFQLGANHAVSFSCVLGQGKRGQQSRQVAQSLEGPIRWLLFAAP